MAEAAAPGPGGPTRRAALLTLFLVSGGIAFGIWIRGEEDLRK